MASKADLDLAKRLLAARVLPEESLRRAFEQQAELISQGRPYPLERILYARKDLPPGSLAPINAPPLLELQPFENYELISMLGEGGSSTVYEGVYIPNGAPVAVKVLDPIQALRADFLERFQQEARMLTEFEHENIVLGYELGYEQGFHFFSMDAVPGMTVLEVIDRRGFLTNDEALSITAQAADALDYLHASGYLHRDVKPSNIMIDADGRARLIDLGLVRDLSSVSPGAGGEETMTVGTVEYVSPEQARGRADLDPRSDIYSLGLTLYHMVVGEVPFQGESDYEVMAKQIMSSLDTQKVKQRRIAPEIHFFITKMTSKDRDSRFESVAEVRDTVLGYVRNVPVAIDFGPEPAPPVAQPVSMPPVATPVAPPVAKPVAPPVARPVKPPVAKPIAPTRSAPVTKPGAPSKRDAPKDPGDAPKPSGSDAPTPTKRPGGAPAPTRRKGPRRGRGGDDGPAAPRRRRRR